MAIVEFQSHRKVLLRSFIVFISIFRRVRTRCQKTLLDNYFKVEFCSYYTFIKISFKYPLEIMNSDRKTHLLLRKYYSSPNYNFSDPSQALLFLLSTKKEFKSWKWILCSSICFWISASLEPQVHPKTLAG